VQTAENRRGLRQVAAMGIVIVAVAGGVGFVTGLTTRQWLALGIGASLVLWIGGAVSGQIILARLIDKGSGQQVVDYLRQLLWIIPVCYVPAGVIAVACGVVLVEITDTSFWNASVLVPLVLYALTAVAGGVLSAPGYVRLTRFAAAYGPEHPQIGRMLAPLAWLNRIELVLVIGVGFTLLAGAVR